MASLIDILNQESAVLLDTSVLRLEEIHDFDLDNAEVLQLLELLKSAENVYISQDVLEEMRKYKRNQKKGIKRHKKQFGKTFAHFSVYQGIHTELKKRAIIISAYLESLGKLALPPLDDNPIYQAFKRIIYLIENKFDIKHGKNLENRTDENTIAAALYLAIALEKKVGIVTNDAHFKVIAQNLFNELTNPQITYQKPLRILFDPKKGMRIYYNSSLDKYVLGFNSGTDVKQSALVNGDISYINFQLSLIEKVLSS